jgi:hypothetical protein
MKNNETSTENQQENSLPPENRAAQIPSQNWRNAHLLASPAGVAYIENQQEVFRAIMHSQETGPVRDPSLKGQLIAAVYETPVVPGSDKTLRDFLSDPEIGEETIAKAIRIKQVGDLMNGMLRSTGHHAVVKYYDLVRKTLIDAAKTKAEKGEEFTSIFVTKTGKEVGLPGLALATLRKKIGNDPTLVEEMFQKWASIMNVIFRHQGAKQKGKLTATENQTLMLTALYRSFLPQEREDDIVKILNEEMIPALMENKSSEELLNIAAKIESIANEQKLEPIFGEKTEEIKAKYQITNLNDLGLPDQRQGIIDNTADILTKMAIQGPGKKESTLINLDPNKIKSTIELFYTDGLIRTAEYTAAINVIREVDPSTLERAELIATVKKEAADKQGNKTDYYAILFKELAELKGITLDPNKDPIPSVLRACSPKRALAR